MVTYNRNCLVTRELSYGKRELVAQALVFLVRVTGQDVPLDEAMNALSAYGSG